MKEILLKAEKLSKSFSNGGAMQHVLKNIDLELHQGDFTVIMGASGAGKSTLLYALSGMDTPTLGKITFGDRVISNLSQDGLAVFRRFCVSADLPHRLNERHGQRPCRRDAGKQGQNSPYSQGEKAV